jgi:hypothetical protein
MSSSPQSGELFLEELSISTSKYSKPVPNIPSFGNSTQFAHEQPMLLEREGGELF